MKWTSVADQLPEYGQEVLGWWVTEGSYPRMCKLMRTHDDFWLAQAPGRWYRVIPPTFWVVLEPPTLLLEEVP